MNQVIRWSNNDILINNSVRIVEPYRAENVSIDAPAQSTNAATLKTSAKGDNDTKTHIIKLVKFRKTKMISNAISNLYRSINSGWINRKRLQILILI
jgi:hypothetical protein